MKFNIKKLEVLPTTLLPNTLYLIKSGEDNFEIFLTDELGTKTFTQLSTANKLDIKTLTMPFVTSVDILDLAQGNIFKIDLTTAGTRPISFINAPESTQTGTIIVKTKGNTGNIVFPGTVKVVDGLDLTPGPHSSIYVVFFDGEEFTIINNARVL